MPCTPGEAEQARVRFEFTFLRDWWHALGSEEQKRAALRDDPDLARRAVLLAWSFRIKPDIVVTIGEDRAVVFEAKWDSPEDTYRYPAIGLTRGQMQLQRGMLTRLLGLAPDRVHSVLLARRPGRHAAVAAAEPVVTWPQAFGCFAGAASPGVRAVLPDAAVSG